LIRLRLCVHYEVRLSTRSVTRRGIETNGEISMRYLLTSAAFFLCVSQAYAVPVNGPSPEADLGLASIAMVAGAAFLAHRLRRR
jgi:hypothetical protein